MKLLTNYKKNMFLVLLSATVGGFTYGAFSANDMPSKVEQKAEPKVILDDLREFKLSVKKFTSMKALDKHHEHLLEEANNTKNSPIIRYTYAMLLGINEPTELTRDMAIEALNKLEKDPSLSSSDKTTINSIKNLMLYKKQNPENPAK